jgi:hypothetical protein
VVIERNRNGLRGVSLNPSWLPSSNPRTRSRGWSTKIPLKVPKRGQESPRGPIYGDPVPVLINHPVTFGNTANVARQPASAGLTVSLLKQGYEERGIRMPSRRGFLKAR